VIAHFLFFEKANYGVAQPVMRTLHERGIVRPVFVKGFDYKESSGVIDPWWPVEPFETLDILDSLTPPDARAADQAARAVPSRLQVSDPGSDFESRAAACLIERHLTQSWMPDVMRALARVQAALGRFCVERQPRFVVLPEDTDYVRGRMAAPVLKAAGATVVILAPHYYNMFVRYPLVGRRYADHYFVMNDVLEGRLRQLEVPPDAISIVGSPAFDDLGAIPPGRPATPTFLFAAQGLATDSCVLADLVAIFRAMPGCQLLIKPHPEQRAAFSGVTGHDNILLLDASEPARAVLARVSCVIAQTSTLLYEAMAIGRPVIVPHYEPGPLPIHLPPEVADGAVAAGREPLARLVRNAVAGRLPQAPAAAIQPAGFSATDRVVRWIETALTLSSSSSTSHDPRTSQARDTPNDSIASRSPRR
jgi:hypothetical protein